MVFNVILIVLMLFLRAYNLLLIAIYIFQDCFNADVYDCFILF